LYRLRALKQTLIRRLFTFRLLLLLLLQASSAAVALQSGCSELVCIIKDWNPALENSFTLNREPAQFMFMKFVNLQTLSLNLAMLQEKGLLERDTSIKNSPVQSVHVPTGIELAALNVHQTDLVYLTFERNNTNLETLCISHSRLKHVPVTVTHLQAVKRIDITFARIETVQFAQFARLLHLTILTLNFNLIKHLDYSPSSDEDFPELKELHLSNNLLKMINFSHFNTMHALEALYLSSNQIINIEPSPLLTPSLKFFDLSHNAIIQLSACNWTVGSLVSFGIHNNSLELFPPCLEDTLSSVKYLHMSFNSLSDDSIWRRVVSLKNLRIIDLGYNRFTSLVMDTVIPSLKYLNLQYNPITRLSVTAANDGLSINVRCGRIEEFDPTNVTHSVIALDMHHCPLDCSWDARCNDVRMNDGWQWLPNPLQYSVELHTGLPCSTKHVFRGSIC
uniref:Leucine rich immune protein (Coil-less) n=1 Tax=Anopheles maculatus TaxID=74869 RepID=A0A182SX33_9DIPT